MADIGKFNHLRIIEESDYGLYLDGGDHGKILLPNAYVRPDMKCGADLRVFVYTDSEDRLVATTETPLAEAGEIACLKIVSINPKVGAFLEWGLSKDLLLPFREQGNREFRAGNSVIVAVYLDEYTNRVVASARLDRHPPEGRPDYEPNTPVHVLIRAETPLGYKAIVDKKFHGLLYHEETSGKLKAGDQFTGYIKGVTPDGKIDLRRDPAGYERVEAVADEVLRALRAAGGSLPVNDKSPPELIRKKFNTSKKAFKNALGALYKQQRIRFTEDGIEVEPLPSQPQHHARL